MLPDKLTAFADCCLAHAFFSQSVTSFFNEKLLLTTIGRQLCILNENTL